MGEYFKVLLPGAQEVKKVQPLVVACFPQANEYQSKA
jgi:hypothetical protein